MASINLSNEIQKINIDKPDYMLGKGLQMPFAASNSGSRKIMFGTQLEHRLPLLNPEVAYIQTGYEMEFGKKSSSYGAYDEDYRLIAKVPKFSWCPGHQYFAILINPVTNALHIIERKEYKHITENYGYLIDNSLIDSADPGYVFKKGTPIQKSTSFDEYDNRMDGVNLLTMYNASEENMEDAIIISESASKKLASPLIKKITVFINDNDIPLNLYGNIDEYKTFPDIGEHTKNSILCALRREKKEESLFSQSYARLRESNISDEKYTVSGKVIDIDVYCNAPARLTEFQYNTQLKRYYDENIRMSSMLVSIVDQYIEAGCELSYEAKRLYSICKGAITGKQYFSERAFSNIIVEITVVENITVLQGDKLSNRYGGKGITARVKPDALMPRTKSGEIIDAVFDMCGVICTACTVMCKYSGLNAGKS